VEALFGLDACPVHTGFCLSRIGGRKSKKIIKKIKTLRKAPVFLIGTPKNNKLSLIISLLYKCPKECAENRKN